MVNVRFYDKVEDALLKYAVIFAKYEGKWIFCKHKARNTFECPGGRREPGEQILDTAKRELYEETGAFKFSLEQLGAYSVTDESGSISYGMLFFAEVTELGVLPAEFEMEKIELFTEMPKSWTYPHIQPVLIKWVIEKIKK